MERESACLAMNSLASGLGARCRESPRKGKGREMSGYTWIRERRVYTEL